MAKIEVEVSIERIEIELVNLLRAKIGASLDEAVVQKVDAKVQAMLKEITKERLELEVNRVLSEGFRTTNSYGEPDGKVKTLESIVREFITKDQYGRSAVSEATQAVVSRGAQTEFLKVLEDVKAKLKAVLDEQVADKLIATLKDALALRRG